MPKVVFSFLLGRLLEVAFNPGQADRKGQSFVKFVISAEETWSHVSIYYSGVPLYIDYIPLLMAYWVLIG